MNELRLDPLRQTWTVFSSARALPPQRPAGATHPSPFSAGREALAPHTLHSAPSAEQWLVRVVPNRAPLIATAVPPGIARDLKGFEERSVHST